MHTTVIWAWAEMEPNQITGEGGSKTPSYQTSFMDVPLTWTIHPQLGVQYIVLSSTGFLIEATKKMVIFEWSIKLLVF